MGLALPDRAGAGRQAMIRTCAKCGRCWAPLQGEPPAPLCPTCAAGMTPLSTLRGGPGKQGKPSPQG
jgi:hypothetical protein